MLTKNGTRMLVMISLLCCSLTGCDKQELNNSSALAQEDEEETICVKDTEFTPLKVCSRKKAGDYWDRNDLISLNDVVFTPNKIRMVVETACWDRELTDLVLSFKVNSKTENYRIKYALPGSKYQVLIPGGKDAKTVQLRKATWKYGRFKVSDSKSLKFPVVLRGANTLYSFSNKHIMVYDAFDCMINDLQLKRFSTFLLHQGATYYRVVE